MKQNKRLIVYLDTAKQGVNNLFEKRKEKRELIINWNKAK